MYSSSSFSHEPSNYEYEEEHFEDALLFSDSLKDLKNLRSQLYSAAEYFEVSYTNEDQKQTVVNTLKDYTISALVNTVDHLGYITYKVTDLLDEKVDEVSGTELRVACIDQRLRTSQECINCEGFSQQSLVMRSPKYHKRYILPSKHVEETVSGGEHGVRKYQGCSFDNRGSQDHLKNGSEHNVQQYQPCSLDSEDSQNHSPNAVQTTIRSSQPSAVRKSRFPSPSRQPFPQRGPFPYTDRRKVSQKRTVSPLRSIFPLLRSGSHSSRPSTPQSSRPITPTSSRPTTPTPSRPTTPNSFNTRPLMPSQTQKSSIHLHAERNNQKDIEQNPGKSKRLFKALLSRRKVKQDDTLYTFLDEY